MQRLGLRADHCTSLTTKIAADFRNLVMQDAKVAKTALEEAEEKWLCKICSDEAVSAVIVPCGHSFCGKCADRAGRSNCPLCRKATSRVQQLFTN